MRDVNHHIAACLIAYFSYSLKVDNSRICACATYENIGFYFQNLLFEIVVINYRPVLIEGILEASYPSSTTMLVMCVMPTAVMQFNSRIKSKALRNIVAATIIAFIAFMVIGRLVSGVHWFTDIVGGALLSAGLVTMYYSVSKM